MTSAEKERANELIAEAADLAGDELDALVARVRKDEPATVREHFDRWLADYRAAEAAGFLASPALSTNNSDSQATIDCGNASPAETIQFTGSDTHRHPASPPDHAGPLLADDYQILEELGKGGMGTVYRAYQISLRKHVAVKIIPSHVVRSPEEAARFHLEAEAAARLDHPGIVPVQAVGERNGVHFYAMALVTGGSLADYVGGPQRLSCREAAEVIEQVARAVQFAHDRAVIHRDIKPANILLDQAGQPRLTDFGLAKLTNADDHLTMTGQVMGTPSYMAPEQAEGDSHAVSTRTDVYSLGATLYALLAGKAPFSGETLLSTLHHVQKSAPPPLPASVPLDLRIICQKCLEKSPADRYPSAGALADDLRRHLDGFPIAARRVSPLRRAVGWSRRNPTEAGLMATVAAVLVLGTVVSTRFAIEARQNLATAEANARQLNAAVEDTFVFASEELLADAPGMQETRRTLLENARRYYETQLATGQLDAAKAADVTFRLAQTEASLGALTTAADTFQRTLELYEPLAENRSGKHLAELLQQIGQVHREFAALGQSLWRHGQENQQAEVAERGLNLFLGHSQQAVDFRSRAAELLPDDPEVARKQANALMNLGLAHLEQWAVTSEPDILAEAERLMQQAQEVRHSVEDLHPEPVKVQFDLALGYEALAELRARKAASAGTEQQRMTLEQEALDLRLQCVETLTKLPNAYQDRRTDRLLATSWQRCGESHSRLGDLPEAIADFEKMLHVFQRLLLRDPGVTANRIGAAQAQYNLFVLKMKAGEEAEALVHFTECQQTLADGAVVRPDAEMPVRLLVSYTVSTAERLAAGGMSVQGASQLRLAKQLLEELPPASSQAEHVQQAIAELDAALETLHEAAAQDKQA